MKFTSEISLKIRTAIKVKLAELGNDVYEELPDYIMVMVANKKSEEQMTEDLTLFLGDNADQFTSWLHILISKLQSIAADSMVEKRALAKPRTSESATATPCDSETEHSNQDASCAIVGSDEASTICMNPKDEAVSLESNSSIDADSTSKSVKCASNSSLSTHVLDDNSGLTDSGVGLKSKKDPYKRKKDPETRIIKVKARKLDQNVRNDKSAAKECPGTRKMSKVHKSKIEESNTMSEESDRNAISSSEKLPNADSYSKVSGEVSSSVQQTKLSKCEEPTQSKDMHPSRKTVHSKTKNKIQLKRL